MYHNSKAIQLIKGAHASAAMPSPAEPWASCCIHTQRARALDWQLHYRQAVALRAGKVVLMGAEGGTVDGNLAQARPRPCQIQL